MFGNLIAFTIVKTPPELSSNSKLPTTSVLETFWGFLSISGKL